MALIGSQASAALRDRQHGACGSDATKRRGEAARFSVKLLAAQDVPGGEGARTERSHAAGSVGGAMQRASVTFAPLVTARWTLREGECEVRGLWRPAPAAMLLPCA
jgi:hypothetical protein